MLRRRLPIVMIIVIGVLLGLAVAGLPSSGQSPPVSTFVVYHFGHPFQSVDPGIGK